ncbi:sensor domain-containing diguanylate cyclase [Candidatus Uabimicrobium amorphum]|uniref:sensor domain-containing diguanylate cyclase n=1 Tax=Uabimicrobium amorphum TaxID=2596890 RepID=UPI00125F70A8|nr:diguanylate cyclase [Candidatus Uabimicrobium amorphum]
MFFSVSSFHFMEAVEYENLQLELQKRGDSCINSFKREIVRNLEVLTGLQGFFSASPTISRDMFFAYTNSVLKGRPSVQALEWIPRVKTEDRLRYEQLAQNEGLTNFVFTERDNGVMIPVKNRQVYFPVYYTAPLQENESVLGFDLSSDSVIKKALQQAISSKKMTGTIPILLIQSREKQKGFMVFIPVYDKVEGDKSTPQILRGFVAGVFDIEKIFQVAMKHAGGNVSGLSFAIFDRTNNQRKSLYQDVFRYDRVWATHKQTILIAQRKWQMIVYVTSHFKTMHLKSNSLVIMSISLCFTFIICLYVKVVLDKHQKNEEIVKLRTQELQTRENQYQQLEKMAKKMEELARTDPLTKLFNRRYFLEKLEEEKNRSGRSSKPFSIVLIDVDHFKSFNDSYGHSCGDFVLQSIANIMKETIRKQDIVARWGGEEFIIMLPETSITGCKTVAEKIKNKVASQVYTYQNKEMSVTITAGVAMHNSDSDIDECIKKADDALYKGKKHGRNEVVIAD